MESIIFDLRLVAGISFCILDIIISFILLYFLDDY